MSEQEIPEAHWSPGDEVDKRSVVRTRGVSKQMPHWPVAIQWLPQTRIRTSTQHEVLTSSESPRETHWIASVGNRTRALLRFLGCLGAENLKERTRTMSMGRARLYVMEAGGSRIAIDSVVRLPTRCSHWDTDKVDLLRSTGTPESDGC
ncbi:hypothetical protein GGX14DRAFT_405842 [Mycena pura]|uniref:Uncharacterized protein n=1 Tax=Mycena pura TaxID=153505 RepID=A0AAD6URJ6_9AGAR|nr:hypothetical protein GGX14DRAFT_405842 [Mycena pura]